MEFLLSLPKLLADLAVGLLKVKKDDRTRQRLADLLADVANCVSQIADAVDKGIHSDERCAELDTYVVHLRDLVAKEVNEETARQLTFWLKHVADAPGHAAEDIGHRIVAETKPRWTRHGRFAQSRDIHEIAGVIRAVANLVRV
jgi:hypothetical protein